ncbi:hypothetical protein ACN28I_42505 [Archangium gephyra]|uniref:hypothetical protein n=1 Tax=Archangium gephyra TaxID=48 RepID=UPI003B80F9E4
MSHGLPSAEELGGGLFGFGQLVLVTGRLSEQGALKMGHPVEVTRKVQQEAGPRQMCPLEGHMLEKIRERRLSQPQ